jgi:hypothetical protein
MGSASAKSQDITDLLDLVRRQKVTDCRRFVQEISCGDRKVQEDLGLLVAKSLVLIAYNVRVDRTKQASRRSKWMMQ